MRPQGLPKMGYWLFLPPLERPATKTAETGAGGKEKQKGEPIFLAPLLLVQSSNSLFASTDRHLSPLRSAPAD